VPIIIFTVLRLDTVIEKIKWCSVNFPRIFNVDVVTEIFYTHFDHLVLLSACSFSMHLRTLMLKGSSIKFVSMFH